MPPKYRLSFEKDIYDLEDLLRTILYLHFDDIRRATRTPGYSLGTRTDFVVGVERVAVAVKLAKFEVRERTAAFQSLYARYAEMYHPLADDAALQYGSRLDRPWIPNPLVRLIRTTLRSRP